MSLMKQSVRTGRLMASRLKAVRTPRSLDTVDYEGTWDQYARDWNHRYPQLDHIGDEWTGQAAGAADTVGQYEQLIEDRFIKPYISPPDDVLEIGIGGGRTAALLQQHCRELVCADISAEMLQATRARLGDDHVRYVKLDGIHLNGIGRNSVDVCFSFDTFVHVEPRDIFNYLNQIPALLRGKRLCVLHHGNTLTDLGWQRFLSEWDKNLMGRSAGSFSVMTDCLMERFLTHLGYEILEKDTQSVPRDCVFIARAPQA